MKLFDETTIPVLVRQLSELQSYAEELMEHLGSIEQSVTKVTCHLIEHQNMLQPISKLPIEILSLIFHYIVDFIPGDTQAMPFPMILALASICRRWRNVIIASPTLWTHIDVGEFYKWQTQKTLSDSGFETCLSRSAGRMLDISFVAARCGDGKKHFPRLGLEGHRWRRLQADVTDFPRNLSPFSIQNYRCNSLAYLSLVNKKSSLNLPINPYFPTRLDNLHTLILIHVTPSPAENLVAPNLKHFTFISPLATIPRLYSNHLSSVFLHSTLSWTTNLQTLRLGVESITFASKVDILHLPHLRHFAVFLKITSLSKESNQFGRLLGMISAPTLEVIELTNTDGTSMSVPNVTAWKHLMVNDNPRFPTVTTAILYDINCKKSQMRYTRQFIDAFPNITRLVLDFRMFELCNDFFKSRDRKVRPPSLRCWEKLEHTRVHLGSACTKQNSKAVHDWCRFREKLGLPRSRLTVRCTLSSADVKTQSRSEPEGLCVDGRIGFVKAGYDEVPWDLISGCQDD